MRKTSIAIAAALAVGTSAYASTLVDDGFETSEGFTTGALFDGWKGSAGNQGGWYGQYYFNSSLGGATANVSSAQGHNSSQSVEIPKQSYFYNFTSRPFEEISSGTATFTWWVYLDSVDTSNKNNTNNLIVNLWDRFDPSGDPYGSGSPNHGTARLGPRLYDGSNDYGGLVNSDSPHTWRVRTGEDPVVQEFIGTDISAAQQWNGYRVTVDVENATFDFDINAGDNGWVQYGAGLKLYDYAKTGPVIIDEIAWYQLSGGNYFHNDSVNAYLDDVSVVLSPEPASLALLGLGGLAMLKRRRV